MSEAAMSEPVRKTSPSVTFLGPAPLDEALVALGVAQHCVFGLDQLRDLGFTSGLIRQRKARSRLHRIHQAVYSLVPRELLTRKGHWMAAVLACGPDAVLSHRTAAALHGLRDTFRAKIDVTVPGRSGRRRAGIDIHSVRNLTPDDITLVDNIPVTSVARTLLDLAEVVAQRPLERAFDESEILEVFDLHAIEDQLARNATRPGAKAVRRVLEEHYIGSTPTQSELEEGMFRLCRRFGLPQPLVQEWVDLGDGEPMIRADFLWRPQRLIVETDGAKYHGTRQAKERDPRRDQRAMLAGWKTLRTTWRQIFRRPHELGPTLVKLVAG
ncbi:MAG: type IV toxin-antitoxin system AbiEi family antitoxin [Solirubrobacteraceae bacterium]